MGGHTNIRRHHDWTFPRVKPCIKRNVSDVGEQIIGHFAQSRTFRVQWRGLLFSLHRRDTGQGLQLNITCETRPAVSTHPWPYALPASHMVVPRLKSRVRTSTLTWRSLGIIACRPLSKVHFQSDYGTGLDSAAV
jgi:hypothetical protein